MQTDPGPGNPSPWVRGVIDDEQVLLCPQCQEEDPAWGAAFQRCSSCDSPRLSIVMGSVLCRACGWDRPAQRR